MCGQGLLDSANTVQRALTGGAGSKPLLASAITVSLVRVRLARVSFIRVCLVRFSLVRVSLARVSLVRVRLAPSCHCCRIHSMVREHILE